MRRPGKNWYSAPRTTRTRRCSCTPAPISSNCATRARQRCSAAKPAGLGAAEAMLAAGTIVGEVGRVKGYIQKASGLCSSRRTLHHLAHAHLHPGTDKDITSWESLTKKVKTVSYKRGIYLYQQRLEALQPAIQPHDVQSESACLQMVLAARDDACVFDDGGISSRGKAAAGAGTQQRVCGRPAAVHLSREETMQGAGAMSCPKPPGTWRRAAFRHSCTASSTKVNSFI